MRLPDGTATTAAGFGTAALTGGRSAAASRRLVDALFDAGVRHFDTAPSYGMGSSEGVLGAALKGRRDRVTIATKVGVARPKRGGALVLARSAAAPLRKLVPGLTRTLGARAYKAATSRGNFDPGFVERSLEESLRLLGTERIDLYLLHEVVPDDVTDALVRLLQAKQAAGLVGAVGTAGSAANGAAIRATWPGVFAVDQRPWGAGEPLPSADAAALTVTHGAIRRGGAAIGDVAALSAATGEDLADPAVRPLVLTGAARVANPAGITLTSSREAARAIATVRAVEDPRWIEAGRRLLAALG